MIVEVERFEDAGTKDADGFYDYYYAGRLIHFALADMVITARIYDDTPHRASLISPTVRGIARPFDALSVRGPAVDAVCAHLRDVLGVTEVVAFVDGEYRRLWPS